MFSVHYKFKATLEYKTLTFDGLHIGVDELKKAICDKENIRTESFDLLLTNAHTKREYAVGELVPRNSSVVVQRIPRENAQKLPKVHDTSTSGIISRNVPAYQQYSSTNSYINPEEFAGMSEEQRLAHIKRVSTEKYSSTNYQRRSGGIMTGPPPATYLCNRCGQPGHWYKSCPLLNLRRTAGITMDELMETDRDDPLAMIHPSGKFVKPIMHHQARMQRKYEPFPGQPDESRSPSQQQSSAISAVPDQFRCRLCGGILRDAVLSACCGHSFCAECYQQQLLTHPTELCPGADCVQQISADSLVPNKMLRDAVQKYLILGIGALEQQPLPTTSTPMAVAPPTTITGGNVESTKAYGGSTTVQEQQQNQQTSPHTVAGVNKPSVLTDTHSLLHKLLPGLAAAQAQRELVTTAKAPTMAAATTTPEQQQTLTSCSVTNNATLTTTTSPMAASSTPPAAHICSGGAAVSLAALFDPNRPPPTLTPEMLSVAAASSMVAGPPTSTMALSAEDSLSVWENFLKRKENEKAERIFQLMRNSGGGSGSGGSVSYQQHQQRHHRTEHRDYHRESHHYHRSSRSRGGGETVRRDEENGRGGAGAEIQPKMTVEEKSTVWKLFEKHNYEKKEVGGGKGKQRGEQEERKKDDGEGEAEVKKKRRDSERESEQTKKDDEGEAEVKKRKRSDSERESEQTKEDDEGEAEVKKRRRRDNERESEQTKGEASQQEFQHQIKEIRVQLVDQVKCLEQLTDEREAEVKKRERRDSERESEQTKEDDEGEAEVKKRRRRENERKSEQTKKNDEGEAKVKKRRRRDNERESEQTKKDDEGEAEVKKRKRRDSERESEQTKKDDEGEAEVKKRKRRDSERENEKKRSKKKKRGRKRERHSSSTTSEERGRKRKRRHKRKRSKKERMEEED